MSQDEEFAKHNPRRIGTVTIDINDNSTVYVNTDFDGTLNLNEIFIVVIELDHIYKKQLELLEDIFKEEPKYKAIFKSMQLLRELHTAEVIQDGE